MHRSWRRSIRIACRSATETAAIASTEDVNPRKRIAHEALQLFRSGTSHRLRIALNLKGIDYEYLPIDLRTEQHLGADYKALNAQGLMPALVDDKHVLIQTPAIIEGLEERYPTPALLPSDLDDRDRVRALAAIVGCDVHPVNNRRILEALRHDFGADEAAVQRWCAR